MFKVSSSSTYLTLEEVIGGKFTTIEKLVHLENLKKDAQRKIMKIDLGEIKDGENFQVPIKKMRRITVDFHLVDGNYEIVS
jgi:hypothetical protein